MTYFVCFCFQNGNRYMNFLFCIFYHKDDILLSDNLIYYLCPRKWWIKLSTLSNFAIFANFTFSGRFFGNFAISKKWYKITTHWPISILFFCFFEAFMKLDHLQSSNNMCLLYLFLVCYTYYIAISPYLSPLNSMYILNPDKFRRKFLICVEIVPTIREISITRWKRTFSKNVDRKPRFNFTSPKFYRHWLQLVRRRGELQGRF